MTTTPETTAAFNELIDALIDARDNYVLDSNRFDTELDVLEGYRYLLQLVSGASEFYVEGSPEHPRMAEIVSPARKLQGDNPDAMYQLSRISADHTYRVRGNKSGADYVSFTVHGKDPGGGLNGPVLADVNDDHFELAADGSYEIVFSAEKHDGNWVELQPGSHMLIVRNYFQQKVSAHNDPARHVVIDIERLDDPGLPPPLEDTTLAARIREGTAFFKAVTIAQAAPSAQNAAPFVSNEPNSVGTPWSFRNADVDAAGAVDIFYSLGRWELQPDQALIMTGKIPPTRFTNVMLWNRHMQTLEYRHRITSLNQAQIELEDDGSYRIVIAHENPGVANFLDVEGHTNGTIFWRFLLPDSDPDKPECTVVPLAEVTA